MDTTTHYSALLMELQTLVEREESAINSDDWHVLALTLQLKQEKLQELLSLKNQVDIQSPQIQEILNRVRISEAAACRRLECKLEEAYRETKVLQDGDRDQRLGLVREIVALHRGLTTKGAA